MPTEGEQEAPPQQPDEELIAPEEVRRVRAIPRPNTPTQEEIDKHCIDHLPYRDWCPYCVEAFGRERAHHSHSTEERDIPLVSLDYMFIAKSGVCARDELPEEERDGALKVLVAKCADTKCIFAHAVPKKGVDPDGYIVHELKEDILWLGHSRVVIRSDNEPALVSVVDRVVKALKVSAGVDSVTSEGSVPYDPQTNGHAEGAVRLIKGQFRAMLLCLEDKVQGRIPLDHPILAWLVSHAATVRNMRLVGTDGKTGQQRARGSSSSTPLLAFGEVCRYKMRAQEQGIGHTAWRWGTGVWLGIERRSGQYMVYDKAQRGVKHARTIKPMPNPQQWQLDKLQEVDSTPWAMTDAQPPEIIPGEPRQAVPTAERAAQARRLYIKQSDIDNHGYTDGCPRCDHLRAYGSEGATMPHSEACRDRLVEAISRTPEGAARLQKAEQRATRYFAKQFPGDFAPQLPAPEAAPAQGGDDVVDVGNDHPSNKNENGQEQPTPQEDQIQPQLQPTVDEPMGGTQVKVWILM